MQTIKPTNINHKQKPKDEQSVARYITSIAIHTAQYFIIMQHLRLGMVSENRNFTFEFKNIIRC